MQTTICTAKASYKKAPGLLELTNTHLQWTQDGKKTPAVRVAHAEAFCKSEITRMRLSGLYFRVGSSVLQQRRRAAGQAEDWSRRRRCGA